MPTRLFPTTSLALALLVLPPSVVCAQTLGRITVEYQNAPLSEVIRAFATYSGRTISVASDVGDPLVTAVVHEVDWRLGLDQILETQALVARLQTPDVMRVERRRLVTLEFNDAPLSQVIRAFATYSDRTIVLPHDVSEMRVTFAVRNVDWQRGLDAILGANGFVVRLDASGVIHIERGQQAPVKPQDAH